MEDDDFFIDGDGFDADAQITIKEQAMISLLESIENHGRKGIDAIKYGERNDIPFITEILQNLVANLTMIRDADEDDEEKLNELISEATKMTTTLTTKNISSVKKLSSSENEDDESVNDSIDRPAPKSDNFDDGTDF